MLATMVRRNVYLTALLASLLVAAPAARGQDAPPAPETDGFDWVRLTNGEWLKGELKELQDDRLVFDSDEFDEVEIDWEDVHSLSVPGGAEVLLEKGGFRFEYLNVRNSGERPVVRGPLRVEGDAVTVQTDEGDVNLERDEVRSILGARKSEWDYWSGKLSFGTTLIQGNVDRTDVSGFARIERRDNLTRLRFGYDGAYSVVDGEETADNHRVTTTYDYYATERLYLRPLDLEVFRDQFQNIAYRVTPAAGAGYSLIDSAETDWRIDASLGYRYTEFEESAPGEPGDEESAVLNLGTTWEWEATPDVDFGTELSATVPLPDSGSYTFRAKLYTAIEIWNDFDLDVQLTWDRVNEPAPNADGSVPDSDEVRFYVGVGWEF